MKGLRDYILAILIILVLLLSPFMFYYFEGVKESDVGFFDFKKIFSMEFFWRKIKEFFFLLPIIIIITILTRLAKNRLK